MKIIKPYGQSKVTLTSQEKQEKERWIVPKKETTEQNISDYLSNDVDFFIANWASILDKIIAKPQNNKKANIKTYQAREAISQSFKQFWQDNETFKQLIEKDKLFQAKWQNKVHPYKKDDNNKNEEFRKGRWFNTFVGSNSKIEQVDWHKVTKKIHQHLYQEQLHFKQNHPSKHPNNKGLIEHRLSSISQNKHQLSKKQKKTNRLQIDELQRILNNSQANNPYIDYQLEGLVLELNKKIKENQEKQKNENNPNKPINHQTVADILYRHYGEIFGTNTKPKELLDNKHEKHYLWLYHQKIKETLAKKFPAKPHTNRVKNPNNHKLFTPDNLHQLTTNQQNNQLINFAIRLGKIIHYESAKQNQNAIDYACSEDSKEQKIQTLEQSHYWLSQGQHEIKQQEGFISQWMTALSFFNLTWSKLLDPENQKRDLLLDREGKPVINNLSFDETFKQQFNLLFGTENTLCTDKEQIQHFLESLRQYTYGIRNSVFHYKKDQTFKEAFVKNPQNETSNENVNNFVKNHLEKFRELIIANLKQAHCQEYFPQDKLNDLVSKILQPKTGTLSLPKFNKLLKKGEGLGLADKDKLIKSVNQNQMQDQQTHCTFTSLKYLYENDFQNWLDNKNSLSLNQWIDIAKQRATQSAKNINKNNSDFNIIFSKADKYLRKAGDNEGIQKYLDYLMQVTASELQLQSSANLYQSDKTNAKKQSNYIEDFKQEIIIYAFRNYLQSNQFNFLLEPTLQNNHHSSLEIAENNLSNPSKTIQLPWLYVMLHLIPVEFVAPLANQIKKLQILRTKNNDSTGQDDSDSLLTSIAQAIHLYLDMHNADSSIKNIDQYEELKFFYQPEGNFKDLFTPNAQQNQPLIPAKGLRELIRFSNVQLLQHYFDQQKITQQQYDDFRDFNPKNATTKPTKIEILQQQRTQLHKQLCKKNKGALNNDIEKVKRYHQIIKKISQYNRLKNHLFLHNHKKIYQLILETLGRFVGFSQRWERDLYFVTLALHFVEPNFKSNKKFKDKINNGQIIMAIRQLNKISSLLEQWFQINDNTEIRNNFAHFNDLRSSNKINLCQLINHCRQLMAYDRKNKNSISRSIIKLMAKNNLNITFKMTDHTLQLDDLKAQTINHLSGFSYQENGKKIEIRENAHSEQLIQSAKKLFSEDHS